MLVERVLCKTGLLFFALLGELLLLETPSIGAPALMAAKIQSVVEEIRFVTSLPPKRREAISDVHAKAVLDIGRAAAPFLIEKLTDRTPTQFIYLFRFEIADIALRLLDEIYRPNNWPFPDGSTVIREKHGDYRDYVEFRHSRGGRERLRESWRRYIKSTDNLKLRYSIPPASGKKAAKQRQLEYSVNEQ